MHPSPIEFWSTWSDRLSVAGLLLGGLVAIVAVIGWVSARKAGQLKDAAYDVFRQESQQRVAEADAKAAEANSTAARANERASRLEVTAAQLRKEAEDARLELEKLKAKQADWVLTAEQRAKLLSGLKAAPKGRIEISFTLGEAERAAKFAKVLAGVFCEAGYTLAPEIGMFSDHDAVAGVYLNYGADEDKERMLAYCQAFLDIGIVSKWYKRKQEDEAAMPWLKNTVCVTVRNKP